MPTGYTADIEKGISFPQFAMSCARAFGALVSMRDDPHDALIPDRLEPSSYHAEKLQETEKKLEDLRALGVAECKSREILERHQAIHYYEDTVLKRKKLRQAYQDMLEKAEAWTEPSPEHVELKRFMRDQITQSIDGDCHIDFLSKPPEEQSGSEWRDKQILSLQQSLGYHSTQLQQEINRVDGRNEWLQQLRESLVNAES